jgi:hypothetical protein
MRKKDKTERGFCYKLWKQRALGFYFSCCSKPFQRDLQVFVLMFKQLFCLLAFHFRFLFPFCHKMNACLLFLPVAVSLDFFVLELRVPCFIFFFLVHKEPWEGGCCFFIISSLLCSFFFLLLERLEGHGFVFSIYTWIEHAFFLSFFLAVCMGDLKQVLVLSKKGVCGYEHCH